MDLLVYGTDLSFLNVGHVFDKQGNRNKNNIIHTSGSKSFQQRSAEKVYGNDIIILDHCQTVVSFTLHLLVKKWAFAWL